MGALEYLYEHGILHADGTREIPRFDFISGVSAGAINGALVAMNKLDALKEFWQDVETKGAGEIMHSDIVESNLQLRKGALFGLLSIKGFVQKLMLGVLPTILSVAIKARQIKENIEGLKYLATNEPLARKLRKVVSKDAIPPGVVYTCGFVSLADGKYYSYRHTDFTNDAELVKGILASSAMPAIFPTVGPIAVNVGEKPIPPLVDGGIRNVSPMKDVIRLIEQDSEVEARGGNTVDYFVIVINNHSNDFLPETEQYQEPHFFKVAMRSLNEIALKEIFNNDIKLFEQINDLVLQADAINQSRGLSADHPDAFRLKRQTAPGEPDKYYRAINYKIIQPRNEDLLGSNLLTEGPDPHDERKTINYIRLRRSIGYTRARDAMENLHSSNTWK